MADETGGPLSTAELDEFLAQPLLLKLACVRPDGWPYVIPLWYAWDGATATIFTSRKSAKVRRIEADPRVALSVEEPLGKPEAWVTIEGTAAIEQHGGIELARELIVRYYTPERAAAVLPSWEKSAADWVVIRLTPTRFESMG